MAKNEVTIRTIPDNWNWHPIYGCFSRMVYRTKFENGHPVECLESYREYRGLAL